jgi:hypothetical protein
MDRLLSTKTISQPYMIPSQAAHRSFPIQSPPHNQITDNQQGASIPITPQQQQQKPAHANTFVHKLYK